MTNDARRMNDEVPMTNRSTRDVVLDRVAFLGPF